MVPECVVDAIPSVEFGNVSMLRFTSVGDTGPQKPFTVDVTCPANIQTGGMTLSLSSPQTDAADPTLLGNSGTYHRYRGGGTGRKRQPGECQRASPGRDLSHRRRRPGACALCAPEP